MIAGVLFAAIATSVAQPLPVAWANWRYSRSIDLKSRGATATIVIPSSIYAKADPALRDLRVIGPAGDAVPFAIEAAASSAPTVWEDAKLTDRGFVPHQYSQAVADLGNARLEYSVIDIATSLDGFSTRVDVDASDDGRTWRTIRTGAPIYDYRQDGLASNTRVSFPVSTARFLRVRVLDPSGAFAISGVRVAFVNGVPPETSRYGPRLSAPARNATAKTSTYMLTGLGQVPIDHVRIDSESPHFVRTVDVQTSGDGVSWETVASGQIKRVVPGQDALSVDFTETHAPRWRLVMHDGDNAPLQNVRVEAFGATRRLYVDVAQNQHYRLIYGNSRASEPVYDYAQTHTVQSLRNAKAASLGPVELNSAYVSPEAQKPWSERNPWIIWVSLAVVVVGIGSLAIRTMTQPPPAA
jgi:hypothetical protein